MNEIHVVEKGVSVLLDHPNTSDKALNCAHQ